MISSAKPSADLVAVVLTHDQAPIFISNFADPVNSMEIQFGERKYVDSGAGEWLGFYDWLRTVDGKVIGVRFRIDCEIDQFPFEWKFRNVRVNGSARIVTALFSNQDSWDESVSCDQNFGDNRLYLNYESRSALVTFCAPGDPFEVLHPAVQA